MLVGNAAGNEMSLNASSVWTFFLLVILNELAVNEQNEQLDCDKIFFLWNAMNIFRIDFDADFETGSMVG